MHCKLTPPGFVIRTLLALIMLLPALAAAQFTTSVSQAFTVQATIQKGCVLGGGSSNVPSFGTINFGQVTLLPANVYVTSSAGAGSVVLKCTPNTSVTISLDSGQNVAGSITGGRKLKNTANTDTLFYQLYSDSGHTAIWGGGTAGGSTQVVTATGLSQELKVYAALFATANMPSAGTYNDTVLVTVTF